MLASGVHLLELARHELLLFAAFWFVIGAIDELAVDATWLWLRLTGRARSRRLPADADRLELGSELAVFVPAWHESRVIGAMIRHTLAAWKQGAYTLYVGCYRNDPQTLAAAVAAAAGDRRVRIVIHAAAGPTTKADCLNRLYAAMEEDEARSGRPVAGIVLQDAEDMVHPAGLVAIDRALREADFVQLPVRPEQQVGARWIAGHYADEFAESHAKGLVVRDCLGAALPAAGVGCGFSRSALKAMAAMRQTQGAGGPFASESLTEDYELGLLIAQSGGRGRFLRLRDAGGTLVATRSFFPTRLDAAVRQKTRWVHGIALQGWDRLGWTGRPIDIWMALRDRRGPLTALVLASAYLLIAIEALLAMASLGGIRTSLAPSPLLAGMLVASTMAFVWRCVFRFAFTSREYGFAEGLRGVLRIPLANIIAIMSGRRAIVAYVRTLRGGAVAWDKTDHLAHPAETTAPGGWQPAPPAPVAVAA